ncbi:tetratricopeptide repeat protein [Methylacidiphilum kamchatkense]|uniref:Tetratricopeptide repeat protein n=1 Tax=Methylacidiphilum kamchatkense Kam1 TaxID=1202785 RepID=A0A516TP91_9BACT|nr:tetratricopeptide repeat protein [Methylacidiphilum kamchatkense]QDQ43056.1 tetratricopeptide repeat protein [Methylacidiphilum kamchatkense Kam1]
MIKRLLFFFFLFLITYCANSWNSFALSLEKHLYDKINESMDDSLLSRVVELSKEFEKSYPQSSDLSTVYLKHAEALYFLAKYEDLITLLSQKGLPPFSVEDSGKIAFWKAEAFRAMEKWTDAIREYEMAEKYLLDTALLEKVWIRKGFSLWQDGRTKEAQETISKVLHSKNAASCAEALLIFGKIALSNGNQNEAKEYFHSVIAKSPNSESGIEAKYWIGKLLEQNHPQEAVSYFQSVVDQAGFSRDINVLGFLELGKTYLALEETGKAMQAFEKGLSLCRKEDLQLLFVKYYLDAAIALSRLNEARQKLFSMFPLEKDSRIGAWVRFIEAEEEAKNDQYDFALLLLEKLLDNQSLLGTDKQVEYTLARIYYEMGSKEPATKYFFKALASTDAHVSEHALFYLGLIDYDKSKFEDSADKFAQAFQKQGELEEEALYNVLLSRARMHNVDDFLKAKEAFLLKYPTSNFRLEIYLTEANLWEELNQFDNAIGILEKALSDPLIKKGKAILLLNLGKLFLKQTKYAEATEEFMRLCNDYPTDKFVPEALYLAVFSDYLAGHIGVHAARERMVEILRKYPSDPIAPKALFSAAEYAYDEADFYGARWLFEEVPKDYPNSELGDQAYYWASKAAIECKDLSGAVLLLEKIPENSPIKSEARLLQGKIYFDQSQYPAAVSLFDGVLDKEPTGKLHVIALLRKADCFFAMAAKEKKYYQEASSLYSNVIKDPSADIEEKDEAAFKFAVCLQKLGRIEDALASFLDVLNGRTDHIKFEADRENPQALQPTLFPEFYWRIKAGVEAALIKEEQKDWMGALTIYRKLESLGGPTQQEFHETLNRLKKEHFLTEGF